MIRQFRFFLSRRRPDTREETTEVMIAPARHDQKPPVVMGTPIDVDSHPVSANSSEFVTRANRPKVSRYSGKVKVLMIGLMIEFTAVNTRAMTASTMMVCEADDESIEIDGTRRIVTHRPAIVANKRAMKSICQFLRSGMMFARPNLMG